MTKHKITIMTISSVFAVWLLLTWTLIPETILPSPQSVLDAAMRRPGSLLGNAGITLLRVLLGWGFGVYAGMKVGLRMTRSSTFCAVMHPLLEIVRPIPPIALTPFFILWFGLGIFGQVLLIALGCFMVLAIHTYIAVENVPPIYVRAAATLGANRDQVYSTVIVPAITPALLSGLRVAAGLAFALAIAAELLGAQRGIGFMMMVARRTLNTDVILLGIVVIGAESYLFDTILRYSFARLGKWTESPRSVVSLVHTK
ncbi:putative Taurine transport system permease protein TauC [Candidatus Sulfopaludibacter sp. SbA6]|nr:putative Taurine transport system permease protein TauC [Candidatus Sulfopaludibacter sp. SbA6]